MLFPSHRQVAHALLTRPPLTSREQAPRSSVRLECVRHAASVHPEPGSNSLINCILHGYLYPYNISVCSALIVFRASFKIQKNLLESLDSFHESCCLCCSIFKDPLPFRTAYSLYYITPAFVNTFFKKIQLFSNYQFGLFILRIFFNILYLPLLRSAISW